MEARDFEENRHIYRRRVQRKSGCGRLRLHTCVRKKEKEISGGAADTTNNRMELSAVIAGLSALKEPCEVTITSDSKYVIDAIEKGWVYGWRDRGWIKSDKKPALNVDLWEQLLALLEKHTVRFVWIKGHAGHEYNERCDRLAVAESEKYKK